MHDAVASGRPFLGICVGMQMLFDGSEEDPTARGLGVIPGTIRGSRRVSSGRRCSGTGCIVSARRRPDVARTRRGPVDVLRALAARRAHRPDTTSSPPATTAASSTSRSVADNVFATQFHPEKSGASGLALLANFVASGAARATAARTLRALMNVARVIPCLDVTNGRVVKGVNFVGLRDAGDPVELAASYDAEGADELVFLDITASSDGRDTMVDVVTPRRRAGVHPVHRRRRDPHRRGRTPDAARRCRQGQRQHRRVRAAAS